MGSEQRGARSCDSRMFRPSWPRSAWRLGGFYESKSREASRGQSARKRSTCSNVLRSELQGRIDGDIQLMRGLAGVVAYQPEIGQADFARLGAELIRGRSEIRSIAAAPNLVVTMLYPTEGNERVLGLDYLHTPDQTRAAVTARDLGTTVLAGPLDLRQGGRGFIIRTPVFVAPGQRRAPVLGPGLDGDRPGRPLPGERPRRPGPDARRRADRARRPRRRRRGLLRRPGDPRTGPGDRPGQPSVRRLGDGRGPEGRVARPGRRLAAAGAVRAGRPPDRGADPRGGASRRLAADQARADPRPRGGAVAALLAAGVRAGGLERRGLGRGPRDGRAALGRAGQGALRLSRAHRAVRRRRLDRCAAPRRPRARGGRGERGGGRQRPLRLGVPDRPAGRRGAAHPRHGRALPGRGRDAPPGRAGLGRDGRRRAAGGAEPAPARGRGGDGGEVALPRGDEPRDPHADERRSRRCSG